MKFHKLIKDGYYENEQTIAEWEMGDFNLIVFWLGKRYDAQIPEYVRLYIREGSENLPQAPLLANPVSWLIFSQRLLDFWWPYIKDDVQVFDAPVYFKNGKKVGGYKLINPICILDVIDWENSKVLRKEDGSLAYISKIFIKEGLVRNHHIFRLKGYLYTVIISDILAKSLVGKNFKGIAFIRCGGTYHKSVKAV